jgi:hypothetical protein
LKAHHVVNLPDHTCFVKTQRDGTPLPVMRVDLTDVDEGDEGTATAIQERRHRYTVDAAEAEQRHRDHIEEAYGMDLGAFKRQLESWRKTQRRVKEERERYEMKRQAEEALAELRAESERTPGSDSQPPLLSVGTSAGPTMPEEMENPRPSKHTRSRRTRKGKDR